MLVFTQAAGQRPTSVRPVSRRPLSRHALLAGVSLSALGVMATANAGSIRPLSPAWFAARVDASLGGAASVGTPASQLAQVTTATRNLATLTTRLQALEAAETAAAAAAAKATSSVPNGLGVGGLQVAPGAVPGSALWLGAALPTQAQTPSQTNVTVTQTQAEASLTWQTFNIGAHTTLHFDQSAGGANAGSWVVLNRVEDPSAAPSQILGAITAPGKVYVINANGIVFGAGSQINLGSLIASTADISDAQFASGIYGAASGTSFLPSFTGAAADSSIVVDAGAQITTTAPASVTAGGGSVMLLGGAVENDGVIETPDGQTILAAGQDFILRQGYSTTGNQTATVQGSQIATTGTLGTATNTGLIVATTGDITLAGHDVTQAGIAVSTTSVNTRGTIHLLNANSDKSASVTLAPGSVTTVDPDNAATTALDSQRQSLITQSAANNLLRATTISATNPQLDDVSTLDDRLDLSRIEITTGGTVAFDDGSLALSQGGQIAVQAGQRAWVGDGAEVDVSGSTGAVLPMSSNELVVNIQGNELRDAPVNRDAGTIASNNVDLDIRDLVQVAASASDAATRDYTAGGLLEVSGYLSNIGHTIDEWDAVGGTITLASKQVISQRLSEMDIAGGSVTVQGGNLPQTYLLGADGHIYNANTAPANIRYVGVYGGLTVDYGRFGGSDTYTSSLATHADLYQSGYTYGRDAGSVIVQAPTAVLEGAIDAGVTNGSRQTSSRAAGITDGYGFSQTTIAQAGSLVVGGFTTAGTLLSPNITITGSYTPVADSIDADTVLPDGLANTITLSASQLNADALGGFSAITAKDITVDGALTLAPGGVLTLDAANVAVNANLTVRGGAITIGDIATNPANGTVTPIIPAKGSGGVTVANSATLDLSGLYTNVSSDPANVAGIGLVDGGALTIQSVGGLTLASGTRIDASSGGALLAGNKTRGGTGGDVTLIGDDPVYGTQTARVTLDAALDDIGVDGGGTLTLQAPSVLVAAAGTTTKNGVVLLTPSTFLSGFSKYVIDGSNGLIVAPGTEVVVAEPVYTFYDGTTGLPSNAPTGTAPDAVFQVMLPPVFQQDPTKARLTQRQGASIELISNDRPGLADFGGGAVTIGAGSAITVDPGQLVRIEAFGQITDDGAIIAHAGTVSLINEQRDVAKTQAQAEALSIWVGGDASIDVSGQAVTALDNFGRPYGTVTAGGSIVIGSDGGEDSTDTQISTDALVLIRPGADLDASGTEATIDLLAGTTPPLSLLYELEPRPAATDPVEVATGGGSIGLSSYSGIDIEGTLDAQSGGAGAGGGTLAMTLETPVSSVGTVTPDGLRKPRVITISDDTQTPLNTGALQPGHKAPLALFGNAAISQQQIDAGGFSNLSLYARDAFVFNGDVALHTDGSIILAQGIITDTATDATVSVTAPYVELSGETNLAAEATSYSINNQSWHPYSKAVTGTFTVDADLIDIENALRFGVSSTVDLSTGKLRKVNYAGFGDVALTSSGDIRFGNSSLTTPGNVDLTAEQIYPTTGAVAAVFAGYNEYTKAANLFLPTGTITVHGNGTAAALPYSVGGSLSLYAGAIVQDGVIRAPEGSITLGGVGIGPGGLLSGQTASGSFTTSVSLLPGSITSVSLAGEDIPYGGTVDGVSYLYDGTAVGTFAPAITIAGQTQTVDQGATLDLSGGGDLSGAGFVSGRGGSTDVLTNPFLVFNAATDSVTIPSLAAAPVYAIVPGIVSGYAPAAVSGSDPAIGSQITIAAGVPGIAPGTYTLMPATFALLPGAARVQINTGSFDTQPGVTALGAASYELNATTSIANTGVHSQMPVEIIVTTAAGVADNSQYDQEGYSDFELAQAARYGTPRANLPEDGKTLNLVFPDVAATTTALNFAGTTLFDPAAGGFGGQATVGGVSTGSLNLEITGDGATPTAGFTSIEASALDALNAPRLIIGGTLQHDASQASQLDFVGTTDQVIIRDGADITAPEIFLTSAASGSSPGAGAITVESGAVLSTLGQGAAPYDSTDGYFYNPFGYSVVALSNGLLDFTPSINQQTAFGAITIADGASLLTDGTLTFATTKGLSLGIGADYGARYLGIDVDNINVVSDAALAEAAAGTLVLPSGLILTQDVLSRLLQGDAASGAPALQSFVLTADQSINFAGSVSLDTLDPATGKSTLQSFVLNTPAIYGYGNAGDTATITTGNLYWNGIETTTTTSASTTPVQVSGLPGAVIANGPGTGQGTLDIDAQNIILGFGPDTAPDDQTTLNRLIEGFANVNLDASESLSTNDRGTLSVYQAVGASYGAPGIGGNLTITTPLLTSGAGGIQGITAGGALTIADTSPSAAQDGALGGELDLTAGSISDDGTILLNSGRLTMTATQGDVDLGAGATVDLGGEAVKLLDQTVYSNGGALVLSATAGNITTDAGSLIDISATAASAGSLQVTAAAGATSLAGAIDGGAAQGQQSGSFNLRTGTLADFDSLNDILTSGSLFGTRDFEIGSGDLVVDQVVQARNVSIATDSGSLTVTGTIDASGAAAGTIALSAGGDLTLANNAVLAAEGLVLQTDSAGALIEAENRGTVSLTTTGGTLHLGDATINVGAPDGIALGLVNFTAPRGLADGAETGAIAIDASGPIDIIGAQTIALYGSRTYTPTDANGTIEQHVDPGIVGSVSLDQINTDNAQFLALADADPGVAASITGLSAYGDAFHLRPADIIQSSAASNGNLTVNGDLDLSTMRYGAAAGTAPGAGEVGMLTLRAANNLTVNGSITDGFATPVDAITHTPDDNGWVLYSSEPLGQAVTLPVDLAKGVVLVSGTSFSTVNAVALNYAIPIAKATLGANQIIPTNVVTAKGFTIPAGGYTATATITGPTGAIIATAGQILAAGTVVPTGSTLATGTVLPFAVEVANGTIWPAGAKLSMFTDLSVRLYLPKQGTLTLGGGAYIPSGSSLEFSSGANSVTVRAKTDGVQGLIYAAAAMLPVGSQSWSINLVGGANLASANILAVQPATSLIGAAPNATDNAGSIVLSDTHYTDPKSFTATDSFSVIRTGTGTLNLVAGGNVDEASLFGVYTAGTQTSLGAAADAAFQVGRATQAGGLVLGRGQTAYTNVIAAQEAYYPDHGGDLLVSAQNDVLGDILGGNASTAVPGTDTVGSWLWRQGGAGLDQSTAWWINFGSYVLPLDANGNVLSTQPALVGFTGFGALGGGNVTVNAGADAGEVTGFSAAEQPISQGLVIAVGSTGRVVGNGTYITGGGLLNLDVAGTLNPTLQNETYDGLGGSLVDLRGDTDVDAGQVGRIDLAYNEINPTDPRPQDPFTTEFAVSSNGLTVVPGDGTVTIDAMRDLVVQGAGDPGREAEQALTAIDPDLLPAKSRSTFGGDTGFTLWTDDTAIDLFSAGGNLTPIVGGASGLPASIVNDAPTDFRYVYPATLDAVAASGSFYYGTQGNATNTAIAYSLELAPSPTGELNFLAEDSIYAHGYAVDISGADPAGLSTQYNPAYTDNSSNPFGTGNLTNILNDIGTNPSPDALFAFEADTPTTNLHADDTDPAHVYAATGDLVDTQFGEVLSFLLNGGPTPSTWYLAAKPFWIVAGRDIISSGTRPGEYPVGYAATTFSTFPNEGAGVNNLTSGNLLLNNTAGSLSVFAAGRDILSSYVYVAGPGLLEVDAGRNIDDSGNSNLDFGVIKSIGPIVDVNAANRTGGASIAVLTGTDGIDSTAFANLYFNAANQADLSIPLSDPANAGKVQQTYQTDLLTWLETYESYTGTAADALGYFQALPTGFKDLFVRDIFYNELLASGREESDPDSLFYKSYVRGRTAIATLFPATTASGAPITYNGSLTMDSGTLSGINTPSGAPAVFDAGIATLFGGSIQILSPGGGDVLGITGGPAPGASSGIITYGSGDIDIYALGSVLLGQSRIFTTFGGNILIWSAQGDINAGRGSKTTTVDQPPLIAYDPYGSVTLAPTAPTSGAGIATLAPLAGTTPGDVDLIAPLGTIDAGEAGIRVSGNLNIAALTVLNAANVQVQGKTSGNTANVATNTAAATSAANAAGAQVSAATTSTPQHTQTPTQSPSIITVEIIDNDNDEDRRHRPAA